MEYIKMEKNTEFNSKRFFIILIVICVLFVIVVVNALSYLPQNNDNESASMIQQGENINRPAQKQEEVVKEESAKSNDAEQNKNVKIKDEKNIDTDLELIEIDTPEGALPDIKTKEDTKTEMTPEEKAERILKNANDLRTSKQYLKALDEYQKVPAETTDKKLVASSYEGISSLYAINKRYGTALTYAIKAYNIEPSSTRELMLARLYYKTGDIQKATQRINNILRRDFSDDRW